MKRCVLWLLAAAFFCAAAMGGCGGGHDGDLGGTDSQPVTDDTVGRGDSREPSGATVDLPAITAAYTAQDGETLTGTLSARVKISIADGAAVTLKDVTIGIGGGKNGSCGDITITGGTITAAAEQ